MFGLLTVLGMIASTTGAKFCLVFGRRKTISWIGLLTFLVALVSAVILNGPLWLSISVLCLYNVVIMFDSGGLTAGTVSASDDYDRGALLAVHSMIGFAGGAIGAPIIGYVLDLTGGEGEIFAWSCALFVLGLGSLLVSLIQLNAQRKP